MFNRTLYMPLALGSFLAFAFTFALAPELHGQNISLLDNTGVPLKQASSSTRIAQATKTKPSNTRPSTVLPSFNADRQHHPNPVPVPSARPTRPARPRPSAPTYESRPQMTIDTEQNHQIGGLGILSYLGSGGGLEYNYRPLSWLTGGVYYTHTQADLTQSISDELDEILSAQMDQFKIQTRYIGLDPVYFGVGMSYAKISGDFGWEGAGVKDGFMSSSYTASVFVADIFLGSQWNIAKDFYLGADWFGFALPITGSIEVDSTTDADLTSEFLSGETIEGRVSNEISAQLKLYYLVARAGYRF